MLNAGINLWAAGATLVLVLGAALLLGRAAARLLPERLRGPGPGPLRILGVMPLDGRRRLYLIAGAAGATALLLTGGGPADRLIPFPGAPEPPRS